CAHAHGHRLLAHIKVGRALEGARGAQCLDPLVEVAYELHALVEPAQEVRVRILQPSALADPLPLGPRPPRGEEWLARGAGVIGHQSAFVARRAPSARASNLAQPTLGSTSGANEARDENPQSALATTFSRPTICAYCTIPSAINWGCST